MPSMKSDIQYEMKQADKTMLETSLSFISIDKSIISGTIINKMNDEINRTTMKNRDLQNILKALKPCLFDPLPSICDGASRVYIYF